jgi:glucose-1-phosphate adenylyltransferase
VTASVRRCPRWSPPAWSSVRCPGQPLGALAEVRVHSYATIADSVLLDDVEVGRYAVIRRAIIDKGVYIPEYCRIGVDHEHDRARGFYVTEGGITVIGKGQKVPL